MDVDAEREKITQEIKELERILYPSSPSARLEVSESSLSSDSEDSPPHEDVDAASAPHVEEERWGQASNDEEDPKDKALPEDPETCLQLNMVYQEVIREKLAEVSLLLAQNQEQQEEILFDLAGAKCPKVKDSKSLPSNMYIGHFMKPYFKDKVTGVGPPANEDTREKAAQGIKAFEELLVTKWKHWEKDLLRKSVVSDRLQRLLQPKLLKLEYLHQKKSRVSSEPEKQALEKQVRETEKEIEDINQLSEETLLGNRMDSHDWEKISNVNFEGRRSAEEIRKFWQSSEHPSINKQEWSAEEVERLKAIAAAHGHLEWHLVAEELGTGRSAFQCLQKFQQYNKALKRKEWTEEEDRMLTQLVQEMRVGNHIPYRKIVYFMEGRDSMQLIYRWTKSLDPNLKKGFWTPEEDAKLLQAVAKHGAQDWFKIREEVPGRSDAQCRDRYLRRLHFSLKKGRWNAKEEEQLIELIEKYGVGHWARIASELPHRSGSQCLSKWKILVRKKQRLQRRRWRRPRQSTQWSSSSSDSSSGSDVSGHWSSSSSSSSEGSEAELEEPLESSREPLSSQYTVPDIDLWVPARQPWRKGAEYCSGHPIVSTCPPNGSDATQGHHKEVSPTASAPDEMNQRVLKVPLETVLKVLKTYPTTQSRTLVTAYSQKERLRQPLQPNSPPGPGPGDSMTGSHLQQLWHGTFQRRQRYRRQALHRRLLKHRLLLAVIPWVGDITLPCTPSSWKPAAVQTQADSIRRQLEHAHLASTPVFTLLIQLLQIDTAGCMEVVRERKIQSQHQQAPGEPSSAQSTTGCLFPSLAAQHTAKRASSRGRPQLKSHSQSATQVPTPAPRGLRPRPKTVSELLCEKRLRESRARKAAQSPTTVPNQLLLSSAVILQPAVPPAPQGSAATGPAMSSAQLCGPVAPIVITSSPSGSWQEAEFSAKDKQIPSLQALPLTPTLNGVQGITSAAYRSLVPTPSQILVSCPLSNLGQSQAPVISQKQGLPKILPFLPAASCPTQLPMHPLNLTPALGTQPLAARASLPANVVLTAQRLLPVSMPAIVSHPQPVRPPEPTGLPVTLPASTKTPTSPVQPSASADGEPRGPQGKEKPPLAGPEKGTLDLSLLSQESEAAIQAWLRGRQGACVPPLGSQLPYQPPALCSLRALSSLLRHKKDLERKAASLAASSAAEVQPESRAGVLQASLGLVRRQLQDNPAYLLLKTRFLAVFTLPALLATLPPDSIPTTLSSAMRESSESEEENLLGDLGLKDRAGQPDCLTQASSPATNPIQGAPDPGEGSAPSQLDASDDLDVLRTRRARHARKRRLL
uniref:snRNA-activating protein complex subunit 4 isoform X1 n=2 Tax=Jaculus jaculus TaxID=51337 RepID=UPI001E1B49D7|nr:snRNA-activating protein complex subunit 4 isoform X1 [Jaculus jaculus]XP_044989640.1 snRNA-activating protein complex subunit 4 isoform X1 [Jaculus jaculus]